jgi:hypothetical protein
MFRFDDHHPRATWLALAAGLVGALLAAVGVAVAATHLGDYALAAHVPDSPAPTIDALARGHVGQAVTDQPVMGLVSVLVRVPFVAAAHAVGGGELLAYRLGIVPCALAVGLLGLALIAAAQTRGRGTVGAAAIAALALLNPLTLSALWWGHPEELLGGALCVGAVLASLEDRPGLAGVLLGLAVGTKEWALLAVVPTLLAARHERVRTLLIAGVLAVPLMLTLPLADPSAFGRTARAIGDLRFLSFTSWWWPFASVHHVTSVVAGTVIHGTVHKLPLGLTRSEVSWLIPLLSIPLGAAFWRSRAGHDRAQALGLLALLLLLRGTLDPVSMLYYYVPFVIALLAWELLTRTGPPVVSLFAIVSLWWTLERSALPAGALVATSGAITVGLAAYLVAQTMGGVAARHGAASVVGVASA